MPIHLLSLTTDFTDFHRLKRNVILSGAKNLMELIKRPFADAQGDYFAVICVNL